MTNFVGSLQVSNKESLFDSIRRIDENGNEYWVARELMTVLGYKTWQKFKVVIEDAMETVGTFVNKVTDHFISTVNMVKRKQGGGINQVDYKLTRFASYHIAMSCDARGNIPVKLARQYFVVKTREAEVVIPQKSETIQILQLQNENLKLENSNLRLKTNYLNRTEAIVSLHGIQTFAFLVGDPDAVVEVVEKVTETIVCKGNSNVSFEGKSTAQLGKELGFKTGTQLEKWLKQYNLEHLICQGLIAVQADYIPTENVRAIKDAYYQNKNRQRLLGEQ